MYNIEKNPYTASNDGLTDQDVPICDRSTLQKKSPNTTVELAYTIVSAEVTFIF